VTVRWGRVGLALLLVCTAVLYLWDLSANGYGNTFYAAAAQAGAHSWSTWFFVVSVAIAASLSQGPVPTAFGRWTGGQSFRSMSVLLAATHTPWSAAINGSCLPQLSRSCRERR
jgi:hypothetical protein